MLLHNKSNVANGYSRTILLSSDMGLEDDSRLVRALCEWAGKTPSRLAKDAGLTPTTLTRPFNGEAGSRISVPTLEKLRAAFPGFDWSDKLLPDAPVSESALAYVEIEVLPTYAGLGGGGTGDGDRALALFPRRLVEDELRAKPSDLLMIELRGDSMEPKFKNGDQILIDKRDVNPVQPGPFALWDGDGYVVKNVERQNGMYRLFSSNTVYSERLANPDDVQIMGRPVWYARRV